MTPNPQLMTAVEQLGYRVTCGDVAAHSGIQIEAVRSGLLDLANQTGGHLAVTDTGEVIYALAPDFRQILLRKYLRLQVEEWVSKIWVVLFYLVKISFGIVLIASISVVYLTILAITLAAMFSDSSGGDCAGGCVLDIFSFGGDSSNNKSEQAEQHLSIRQKTQRKSLNFLEAVFSVLFGDGNPNADLEQRRWTYIANLIHRQQGAVIGEQIAPFLDQIGRGFDRDYENYMLPVLTKFNGIPEVSPTGQLVYHFPDLQTTIKNNPGESKRVPQILRERKWKFSKATSDQTQWSITLIIANLVGVGILGTMLSNTGGTLIATILWGLTIYGIGLIVIPTCRYFWVRHQNSQVKLRNQARHQEVKLLLQDSSIQEKLDFAKQFAKQYKITDRDIIYTTEEDALDQELKRLEQSP